MIIPKSRCLHLHPRIFLEYISQPFHLLEDENVLEMLNADMSFFQAAAELKVPPELLDFKFRMMKRSGVQIIDSPITSNSDFLKDIPTSGIIENY